MLGTLAPTTTFALVSMATSTNDLDGANRAISPKSSPSSLPMPIHVPLLVNLTVTAMAKEVLAMAILLLPTPILTQPRLDLSPLKELRLLQQQGRLHRHLMPLVITMYEM